MSLYINFGRPGELLGSSMAFGSGCGERFRGCRAKRLYVDSRRCSSAAATTTTSTFPSKYLHPWPAPPTQHFRGQRKRCAAARGDPDASPTPGRGPVRGQGGLRTHAQHTCAAPSASLRLHVKDEHAKDAALDVAEEVPQDVVQDLAFGALAARALLAMPPPPPPPSLCSSR